MDRRLGVLAFGDSITNGGGELQWGVALQSWALWVARGLGLPFTTYAVDGARFAMWVGISAEMIRSRSATGSDSGGRGVDPVHGGRGAGTTVTSWVVSRVSGADTRGPRRSGPSRLVGWEATLPADHTRSGASEGKPSRERRISAATSATLMYLR